MHIRKVTYNNQFKLRKMNTVIQRQREAFAFSCTKPTSAVPLNSSAVIDIGYKSLVLPCRVWRCHHL